MLTAESFSPGIIIFIAFLFVIIRPLAVFAGLFGCGLNFRDRGFIAWFGIRGIGSVYYLSYAVQHGVSGDTAGQIADLVLGTVAISVAVHGVSVTPLMSW